MGRMCCPPLCRALTFIIREMTDSSLYMERLDKGAISLLERRRNAHLPFCRVGQKNKLLHFAHIFANNCPIFTIFFTGRMYKKFATQWHVYQVHYVATLPCETGIFKNQQYLQMGRRSSGKCLKYSTEMLNINYGKCPKNCHIAIE